MEEISNRIIIILLIGAIVISLGGTIISFNRVSHTKSVTVTGFLAGDKNASLGNVSLTIADITWINFSWRKCNLGQGYVLRNKCELNSSGYYNSSSCSPQFSTNTCTGLDIMNIGNNNVTLNISWKNNSAFIGTNAELWFKMKNGTRLDPNPVTNKNGCMAGQGNFDNKWNYVWHAGMTNITCQRMFYGTSNNLISIHVRVRVPQGVTSGKKENIITAIGKAI